jgi:hypothetical protein
MRKRRLLPLGILIILLAVGYAVLARTAPKGHINRATAELIRPRMTAGHVEDILGVPPGDYRTGEVEFPHTGPDVDRDRTEFDNVIFDIEWLSGKRRLRIEWWTGNEGGLWVCFDQSDQVVTHSFVPGKLKSPGFLDRIHRWLGW